MNGCIYRTRSDLCMKFTTDESISFCVGKKCPDRKESNADRIRSMTDEELAEAFASIGRHSEKEYMHWLRKKCTDDETTSATKCTGTAFDGEKGR